MDSVQVPCELWNAIVDFITDRVDVRDGLDGAPTPNEAMHLVSRIEQEGL